MRRTGIYTTSTTLGEAVQAFVPLPLPPSDPVLAPDCFAAGNHAAELALARLSGVSGLVPSVDWLLYSAVRKEALLTSQIEGTQATLIDLFDEEAGFAIGNTDDVEEVTNYLRAFRLVQDNLRDPAGLPISVRLVVRCPPFAAQRRSRQWQAARRVASFAKLDWRHAARQRGVCAAAGGAGGGFAGRCRALHSCRLGRYPGLAAAGENCAGACPV
jgi:hypothetical protein